MTPEERRIARVLTEAYIREHLVECAKELLDWHNTALLCNGHVRKVAKDCETWAFNDLYLVESMVNRAALEFVAGGGGGY